MPKDKDLLVHRNCELNQLYTKLSHEGHSHQETLSLLSAKFFLAERTIYGIISGEYERRRQQPGKNSNQ